ncbi:MAG: HAMP domain-containing protein [Gammaproteobacteria bacterium]|nr:HAMP domain-containing protein [Gammaproteobacteria bacterium]
MPLNLPKLNRLQRKVVLIILVMVVVPMLVAGALASAWVSSNFEERLQRWIEESAVVAQTWLQDYQNDAILLGHVLADDPEFIVNLDSAEPTPLKQPLDQVIQKMGISFVQVYNARNKLIYSSAPVSFQSSWEPGQSEAVLKVTQKNKSVLATVGITPLPREGLARYYVVLGSLLDQDFINKLDQLSGLKTRLYYREGNNFYDLFSKPDEVQSLKHLPKEALKRLQQDKKPYYSLVAEQGQFRGQYTPILDSEGHVEAIIFSGLERRGFEEILTNRLVMFLLISLLGIAIGVLAGVLLSRLIVRPVEYLRSGVMQLAGQNFHAEVPVSSNDELGDLAKAFNAMAVSLRQARDEQQQRFQKDKLSALGELSAALAHEIRNPIGVVNTAAALLEKPDTDAKKHAELTRMLREESMRVNNLVQDFLQLSRYRQPEFASIDPTTPLERALGTALAGRNNIRVTRRLEHGDVRINADANLLQQAWGNILTNALQAIGERDGELTLTSVREDGCILIAVEDSGPGISPEAMPRLFEPFFTNKEQGTGLGLTIANTLVEANGGNLKILEPEKSGARFGMRFPIHEQAFP